MSMGILNALRQTKAQDNSLASLAQLPQQELMRMVQTKQIKPEMLAPILGAKAEMADNIAKMNALKQGGGQMPSVLEQKMAQIAQAQNPPAPMTTENTGVAQLPVPPRAYAGGGIVAFENNKDQPVDYTMPSRDDEGNRMPYNPSQGAPEYISDVPEYLGAKLGPFFSSLREQINTGRVSPGATWNPTSQAVAPAAVNTATSPVPKKDTGIIIHDNKNKGVSKPGIANALQEADTRNQAQGPSELSQALDLMRKDLEAGTADRKAARKEARDMRMFQAAMDIMGGTSPYPFVNLSQGSKALQGYGEDIKGLRGEEADTRKQLAALGLKGIELKQSEKELGAKVPLYGAQTQQALANASYLRSGKGTLGGTVSPEVTRKMMEQYKTIAANPKSDPAFFASLPPDIQNALKTSVGSPSYNRGLETAKQYANSEMMRELQFIGSLNRKSAAPAAE